MKNKKKSEHVFICARRKQINISRVIRISELILIENSARSASQKKKQHNFGKDDIYITFVCSSQLKGMEIQIASFFFFTRINHHR